MRPSGIEGRVAVVTGGTGALGRAVVQALVDEGARVHVPWFDRAEAEEAEGALRERFGEGGGGVRMRAADLTSEDSTAAFFAAVKQADGDAEILLNLAGGFSMGPLEKTELSTWNGMLALNATSAFLCARAAVPAMREAGWGRIVNVAAMPALERGAARMSAYGASKAAVLNLTYSLADELGGYGITVNAVVPTTLDTPANRASMPRADTSTWLAPQDVARVLRFLVSDDAAVVTGAALSLGRGRRHG